MGAIWYNNVYAISCHLYATAPLNMTQLEMLNVLVALCMFSHLWSRKTVRFHVDNMPVVFVLSKRTNMGQLFAKCG